MAWLRQTYRRFRYGRPIVVVSGLPRSGTSMMMKMLESGGIPVWQDGVPSADDQNPKGYYELERVKELDKGLDKIWVREGRGRAVKVISSLLEHLPPTNKYQVVFMNRNLQEVLDSQSKMLSQRGEQGGSVSDATLLRFYEKHLRKVKYFLAHEPGFSSLDVNMRRFSRTPSDGAARPGLPRRQPQRRGHDRGRRRAAVSQPAAGRRRSDIAAAAVRGVEMIHQSLNRPIRLCRVSTTSLPAFSIGIVVVSTTRSACEWRLERIVNSREVPDLAAARLRVQALHIALLADGERSRHVHLHEVLAEAADEVARFAVRRDERGHDEHTILLQLAGQVPNPFDVGVALDSRESGVREDVSNRVAVQPFDLEAARDQLAGRPVRDRALAGARESRKPEDQWLDLQSSEAQPIPDPLVEPVQPDLRHELESTHGQGKREPASEREHERGGGHRAEDSPGERLGDGPRWRLLVHQHMLTLDAPRRHAVRPKTPAYDDHIVKVARMAAVLLLAAASAPTAQTRQPSPMNAIAERYVKLVLALGQHDADYVDAFYGPPEWKAEAESRRRRSPRSALRAAA